MVFTDNYNETIDRRCAVSAATHRGSTFSRYHMHMLHVLAYQAAVTLQSILTCAVLPFAAMYATTPLARS